LFVNKLERKMAHQRGSRENNEHRGTLFLIIYLRVLGRRWTIFVSTDVYDLTFKSILIQEAFFDITDCDEFLANATAHH